MRHNAKNTSMIRALVILAWTVITLFFVMPVAAEESAAEVQVQTVAAGDQLEGSFTPEELKVLLRVSSLEKVDVATVRYIYTNQAGKKTYGLAEITGDVESGITYSFQAPAAGFEAVEGASFTNKDPDAAATVVAACFRTDVWDGAVDVSWYDETSAAFHISTPAQMAGLAAIVNGNVDASCDGYEIKGDRVVSVTDALTAKAGSYQDPNTVGTTPFYYRLDGTDYKHCVTAIASTYKADAVLPADQDGAAHLGLVAHNFANRTVILDSDLNLGGAPGAEIDHLRNYNSHTRDQIHEHFVNSYEYPNWTPVGGAYLGDLDDPATLSMAFFNGTFEGNGHRIDNMYCYRWSYPAEKRMAYAYAEGTGLFGSVGGYYQSQGDPIDTSPAIRDMSVSGYVFGRRSVGGLIGTFGRGTNANWDNPIEEVYVENCANHAYAYSTDSKGVGGIVGHVWSGGAIINCYNTGTLRSYEYCTVVSGICGENRGADICNCYNIGEISTSGMKVGYGIGSHAAGDDYTVADCYFRDGDSYYECSVSKYQGYYYKNASSSVSVSVERMTDEQLTDGTLLDGLNTNGEAYVAGEGGLPVLAWEKSRPVSETVTVRQPEHGSITTSSSHSTHATGTVVYLTHQADLGWSFRYYTLNGTRINTPHVTVNGNCVISAVYEEAKAGVLKIAECEDATITVIKTGTIVVDGEKQSVTDHPVADGDSLFEDDKLTVTVELKDGAVPEDPDLIYQGAYPTDYPKPYQYNWTYTGQDTSGSSSNNFEINKPMDDISLTLSVDLLTARKTWLQVADTSWYNGSASTFTLTTARQLAGLDKLVSGGNSFSGKTIRLGQDVSFANDDGTAGKRWWNGIGLGNKAFSGTFDGNNKAVRNLLTSEKGFFDYCSNATIKNLTAYGSGEGAGASGICAKAGNTSFANCSSYRTLTTSAASGAYLGGILGEETGGCSITGCYNYGDIHALGEGLTYLGGIVGSVKTGSIVHSVNCGMIRKTGVAMSYVGGVAGQSSATISRCANYGDVTGASGSIGGVIGFSITGMTLNDSYNVGEVTCDRGQYADDGLGGLIGYAQSFNVSNCFNYGVVSKKGGAVTEHVGGVFGIAGVRGATPKSTDKTSNVYFSTTSSVFAVDGNVLTMLNRNTTYYQGLNVATPADFASATGVLTRINGNSAFSLVNGKYPELTSPSWHHHSGGTATCSKRAVCSSCGLSYGSYDSANHDGEEVKTGRIEPEWVTDGTTGDIICSTCKAVIQQGTAISADRDAQALTVSFARDGTVFRTVEYSREQLDQLAEVNPISWQYGPGMASRLYTTRYVTLDRLMAVGGYSMSDGLTSVTVVTSAAEKDFTRGKLLDESRYYYDIPNELYRSVSAAIAIYSCRGDEELEVLEENQKHRGLVFGHGISSTIFQNGYIIGADTFLEPVNALTINVSEEKHKITFDAAGGSRTADQFVADGQKADKPKTPYMEDHTFLGWYTEDGAAYDFTKPVTEDLTLTARWERTKCKVTFAPNGGTVGEKTRTVLSGNTIGALPTPVRAGYTFKGWVNGNAVYSASNVIRSNITLTARWEIIKVRVYKLYNKKTKDRMYTTDLAEYNRLGKKKWKKQGVAWYAPQVGKAVYCQYNKKQKQHQYTTAKKVKGWKVQYKGKPVFYAGGSVKVYHLYNPKAKKSHYYTTSAAEYKKMAKKKWKKKGSPFTAVQ